MNFGPLDDEFFDGPPIERLPLWEAFFIGQPAPQGSKTPLGGFKMKESSKYLKPWRAAVKAQAERLAPPEPMDGPLDLHVTFWVQRPKGHSQRHRTWPSVRPDLSKYIRAVEDSLTDAKVIKDDSRIVHIEAWKRYVHPPHLRFAYEPDKTGAHVEVVHHTSLT